jgi:hypothetical protein
MANVDSPFGFVPVGTTDGSDYHAKLRNVNITAGANGASVGDPVFVIIGSDLTGVFKNVQTFPSGEVVDVAAATPQVGVITSITPDFEDEGSLTENNSFASGTRKGTIAYGSNVLFAVQSNYVNLDTDDIGKNSNWTMAPADSIGTSQAQLTSAPVVTGTLPMRIHYLQAQQGNLPEQYGILVVSLNGSADDSGVTI